jgi:hypothetical protein
VYEASCSITAHGVCFACWTDRAWAQAQSGDATTYTQQTFYDWVKQYKTPSRSSRPADTLTNADLEKVKPFMMPGYFEQYVKWKDLKMEVVDTYHVKPHKMVLDCNEKVSKAGKACG